MHLFRLHFIIVPPENGIKLCVVNGNGLMSEIIAEQINLLKRGTVEIFTEAEMAQKLTAASKTGRQLRIKLGLDPTSPDIHLPVHLSRIGTDYLSSKGMGQVSRKSGFACGRMPQYGDQIVGVLRHRIHLPNIINENKVDFETVDNIVSLGCGNGLTDNMFLKKVVKINRSICYIPVDINTMMVSIASENIDKTVRMPFAIIDDFETNADHIK